MIKSLLLTSALLVTAVAPVAVSAQAKAYYDPVVLIESVTSTTSYAAPKYYAFDQYFTNKYTGGEDGKAICVVVHVDDAMALANSEYADNLGGLNHNRFSRTYTSDIVSKKTFESLLSDGNTSRINIDMATVENGKIVVKYSVRRGYVADDLNFRSLFIISENDVKGTEEGYNQNNEIYSGYPITALTKNYGTDAANCFRKYVDAPSEIPGEDMTYNFVARGIYPDYTGITLHGEVLADTDTQFEYEIELPDNILNIENITLIGVLLDNENGRMEYADAVPYSEFGKDLSKPWSGVEVIAEDTFPVEASMQGDNLVITAEGEGTAEVFTAAGTKVASARISAGENTINLAHASGVLIVKINAGYRIITAKVMK